MRSKSLALVALLLIVIVGVAFAAYKLSLSSAQIATNPLSPPSQPASGPVVEANTTIIGTTPIIATSSVAGVAEPNPAVANNYYSCTSVHSGASAQCYGQLYQESTGCVVLIVPVMDPNNNAGTVNQYYTLLNMPANHPGIGSWVTVTGQVLRAPAGASDGQSCPSSSINVTQISQSS
jgi:hypothetical protein